jgi:hypothetical protein
MSFMEAQITDKSWWIEVDGNAGIEWIPREFVTASRPNGIPTFEECADYLESSRGYSEPQVIRGYGVRLSAPGYMDCTPWTVYRNKRDAWQAYRELERENEGDE